VNKSQIIVALDFPDSSTALALASQLDPAACRLKIGKELFTRSGPALVEKLILDGFDVFLDLKYHDIPNTVASACAAAADLGVWMVNVHASGGRKMMQAAAEKLAGYSQRPLLIGVTVLTSMDSQDLREIGLNVSSEQQVIRLAGLTREAGLDGVVCSSQEVTSLRSVIGQEFKLVTPGIRPAGAGKQDQVRIATPGQAILDGSDYLVIGRPITQAQDPLQALRDIQAEINQVLSSQS
jgi:orotidine-5'-phosphate decarboxylase